jgi:hypothetical protein
MSRMGKKRVKEGIKGKGQKVAALAALAAAGPLEAVRSGQVDAVNVVGA